MDEFYPEVDCHKKFSVSEDTFFLAGQNYIDEKVYSTTISNDALICYCKTENKKVKDESERKTLKDYFNLYENEFDQDDIEEIKESVDQD